VLHRIALPVVSEWYQSAANRVPSEYVHVISAGFEPMIESVRHGVRL
jgi:hypothetical protein